MSKKGLYKHKRSGDLFAIETDEGEDEKRIARMQLAELLSEIVTDNYKAHRWGPLRRVRMPDNTYRWLCKEHAEEYRK